jgi:hypothetical protein
MFWFLVLALRPPFNCLTSLKFIGSTLDSIFDLKYKPRLIIHVSDDTSDETVPSCRLKRKYNILCRDQLIC